MKFKNILFDLDGTIIKSEEGVTKGVEKSLKEIGIEVGDRSKLLKFLGPPLYESYTMYYGLDDKQYKKALDIFHEYYRSKGIFECEVYSGLKESLDKLVKNGYRLFVATSKPEPEARRIIEHFSLEKYFEFVGGADGDHGTSRDTKTKVIEYVMESMKLNKDESIMLGDRFHDIEGAKNVGIECACVLYGYGNEEEFKKYKADYIIEKTSDIAEFFMNLV